MIRIEKDLHALWISKMPMFVFKYLVQRFISNTCCSKLELMSSKSTGLSIMIAHFIIVLSAKLIDELSVENIFLLSLLSFALC